MFRPGRGSAHVCEHLVTAVRHAPLTHADWRPARGLAIRAKTHLDMTRVASCSGPGSRQRDAAKRAMRNVFASVRQVKLRGTPCPPPSRALLPPVPSSLPLCVGSQPFFLFTQGSAALHGAHGGLTCKPALPGYASWVHALAARIRHRGVAGRGWRHVADGRGEVDAFVCSYVGAAARYAVAACAPRSRLCLLRAGSWPRLGNPRWATRSQVDRQTAMYT